MKHIIVGMAVAIGVAVTFAFWALLGALVGPEWAIAVMFLAAGAGIGAGAIDYYTEKGEPE